MKLECVLVACNENPHYLNFWPIVKEAWTTLVHVPVKMIYVGHSFPETLQADPDVIFFQALDTWPTATQAQCIRNLYGGLLPYDGAVLLSDMDMIPMQSKFFHNGLEGAPDTFVSLRGIDEEYKIIYMCYAAASPKIWRALFQIETIDDVRAKLTEWSRSISSDGRHAGEGWGTDQEQLYKAVKSYMKTTPVHLLPCCPIERVDRIDASIYSYPPSMRSRVKARTYVDFHMPEWNSHHDLIRRIFRDAKE